MQKDIEENCSLDFYDIMLWRPVMVQKAHKWEIDEKWSVNDLVEFTELQDIEDDLKKEEYDKINK